jgi:hypothetical protein
MTLDSMLRARICLGALRTATLALRLWPIWSGPLSRGYWHGSTSKRNRGTRMVSAPFLRLLESGVGERIERAKGEALEVLR